MSKSLGNVIDPRTVISGGKVRLLTRLGRVHREQQPMRSWCLSAC